MSERTHHQIFDDRQRRETMHSGATVLSPAELANLRDARARPLHDLRLSVTDRCNFRCTYCMPAHLFGADHRFLPRHDILTFEEMQRSVRLLLPLGLRKVRLTGGEPLLRQNLATLIRTLSTLRTPQGQPLDITLTTNGALLRQNLPALIAAGLKRITLSLDALSPATFAKMNAVDFPVQRVLDALDAAVQAGLQVKLNMVVIRHTNEQEILPLADYIRKHYPKPSNGESPVVLRFIEFMDVGNSNAWQWDRVVAAEEIVAQINAAHPLTRIPANYRGEVAKRYRFNDGQGEIGVIASVSAPFCGDCSRLRLSADGQFYTCLFAPSGHDWRGQLRSTADDETLTRTLTHLWQSRTDNYSERRATPSPNHPTPSKVEMSYIGG